MFCMDFLNDCNSNCTLNITLSNIYPVPIIYPDSYIIRVHSSSVMNVMLGM